MKVLYVTPAFYPATYWGGPIYSVYGLCNALAKTQNISLRVLTTDSAGPRPSDRVKVSGFPMLYKSGYEVYFCSRWWAASVSPSMILRLWSMIRSADVVHLTAVYSPPTIPTLLICRVLSKAVVWSPRGSLQRWERATRPLVKKVYEWICNALVSRGCILHVTSTEEAINSSPRIPKAKVVVISNGVDIPEALPGRSWLPDGKLRLLYIGRLHPIKGIENLFQAIKQLNDESVLLTVCGDGDSAYSRSLKTLIIRLGLDDRVTFNGHVDGLKKEQAFMLADVCVVPSFTENFGMVVAEALAHGVPVIASKGTPWKDIEKHGCGLWTENSPDQFAQAIRQMKTAPLCVMGARGRNWMKDSYSWDKFASEMFLAYRHVASRI